MHQLPSQQASLTFELPAMLEGLLLRIAAQGAGATDYVGLRAVALDLYASGALPVVAPTAEAQAEDVPKRTARAGRRAGCDSVTPLPDLWSVAEVAV